MPDSRVGVIAYRFGDQDCFTTQVLQTLRIEGGKVYGTYKSPLNTEAFSLPLQKIRNLSIQLSVDRRTDMQSHAPLSMNT